MFLARHPFLVLVINKDAINERCMNTVKDLTGQRFGLLTVMRQAGRTKYSTVMWECQCDCGNTVMRERRILVKSSKRKVSINCGCLYARNQKHHMTGSPTYITWKSMKQRCLNPNSTSFPYYGGRGITICDRWDDFLNFYEDMGERPEGMSLDRIDSDKGYYKENCKWSTIEEQNRNRRYCKKVSV